jgi:hypothetical protein
MDDDAAGEGMLMTWIVPFSAPKSFSPTDSSALPGCAVTYSSFCSLYFARFPPVPHSPPPDPPIFMNPPRSSLSLSVLLLDLPPVPLRMKGSGFSVRASSSSPYFGSRPGFMLVFLFFRLYFLFNCSPYRAPRKPADHLCQPRVVPPENGCFDVIFVSHVAPQPQ